MEGGFDDDAVAYTAEGEGSIAWDGFAAWVGRFRVRPKGENLAEQTDTLFWANTMGWVCGIVEAPDSCNAVLTVGDQNRSVRIIVLPLQHLFTLGHIVGTAGGCWTQRGRMGESCLGSGLDVGVRCRRTIMHWRVLGYG